jgi:hypothetical protein
LEGADATASALENFEVFKALFESFTSKTSEHRGAAGEPRGHTGYGMIRDDHAPSGSYMFIYPQIPDGRGPMYHVLTMANIEYRDCQHIIGENLGY